MPTPIPALPLAQLNELIISRDQRTVQVSKTLAQQLSVSVTQDTVDGVPVFYVVPRTVDERHKEHLFVHVHGGAFIFNGGKAATYEAILLAARLKMPVLSIDYRMPPEYPAPAAIDDLITVWQNLIADRRSTSIALGGSSAGASLSMSLLHALKEKDNSMPGALFVGTPACELDMAGDSRFINEGIDRIMVTWRGLAQQGVNLYVGDADRKDPLISPIYGTFDRFPPSYLISGTRDLHLSDTVRVHRALRRAGVEADLNVYEGLSHAEYVRANDTPESLEHFAELNSFLLKHLTEK